MRLFVSTIAALGLLAGCASPVPVAENFSMSTQKKVRATEHWNIMADDVVLQTLESLEGKDYLQGRSLYVRQAEGQKAAFDTAFHNFIITNMVNRGLPVSQHSPGTVEIVYETQIVKHKSERPAYQPGLFTALTGGVMVARNVPKWSSGAKAAGALGVAAAADVAAGHVTGGPTNSELVVTTSIVADGVFVMRKSDVYYVEDADASLFDETVSKKWKVVGQ